jgi:hypothetical protein
MAIEDFFKSNTGKGIAIGIGVAVLAPLVLPTVARAARPLARAAIKSGLLFFEKGRETAAELGEVIDDLLAEAQAEIEQSQQAADNVEDATEETFVETTVEPSKS